MADLSNSSRRLPLGARPFTGTAGTRAESPAKSPTSSAAVRPFTPPGARTTDRPAERQSPPQPTPQRDAISERSRVAAIVQGVADQVRSGQIQLPSGSATGDAPAVLAAVLAALLGSRR